MRKRKKRGKIRPPRSILIPPSPGGRSKSCSKSTHSTDLWKPIQAELLGSIFWKSLLMPCESQAAAFSRGNAEIEEDAARSFVFHCFWECICSLWQWLTARLSFLFCSSNKEDKSVIIQLPVFNIKSCLLHTAPGKISILQPFEISCVFPSHLFTRTTEK